MCSLFDCDLSTLMVFVLNAANFVTIFLWYWFFSLQIYDLYSQSSPYLCMPFVIHFQMFSCMSHTQPLKPASSTACCFAWTCLCRVLCKQLQNLLLLFSPLKISLLLWWTKKQKNTCEKFDCHNDACVSDWLLCLSVASYLSAVVISALKLIIWSGEQYLLCAESLEQRSPGDYCSSNPPIFSIVSGHTLWSVRKKCKFVTF